jgi:hypothetical protein
MLIWDPTKILPLGNDTCRLSVVKLEFIIFTVQPTVDMFMRTEYANNDIEKPIFMIESIKFDPNVQILPSPFNMNNNNNNINVQSLGRDYN